MTFLRKKKGESPDDREARETIEQLKAITGEHFDAGAIILSREINGKTEYYHAQIGNSFAVRGIVEAFMEGAFVSDEEEED
jgi:hypothetical protein